MDKLKALITVLKSENKDRDIAINDRECSDYARTALIHKYNNTLDVLKRLDGIVE